MSKNLIISLNLKKKFGEFNYKSLLRCQNYSTTFSSNKTVYAFTTSRYQPWLQKYEQIVGLKEVKDAQDKVLQAEKNFQQVQLDRRNLQFKMTEIQNKLKDIHNRLEKLTRGDERYLSLLTEEYEIMQDEKRLTQELQLVEQSEHDEFAALSSSVRESHEKERTRAEKTKYWSIVGSFIGAVIGILGTSLNNHYRMKEIKSMMSSGIQTHDQLKLSVDKLSKASAFQFQQLFTFIEDLRAIAKGDDIKDFLKTTASTEIGTSNNDIRNTLLRQEAMLHNDLEQLKSMLTLKLATSSVENIVYVGPDMYALLDKMEESIEWKIKKNAVISMGVFYASIGAAASVIYFLMKESL